MFALYRIAFHSVAKTIQDGPSVHIGNDCLRSDIWNEALLLRSASESLVSDRLSGRRHSETVQSGVFTLYRIGFHNGPKTYPPQCKRSLSQTVASVRLTELYTGGSGLESQSSETFVTDLFMYRGFSRQPCWRAEIDLISQRRENVLFFPSNMAAMTSHENDSSFSVTRSKNSDHCGGSWVTNPRL